MQEMESEAAAGAGGGGDGAAGAASSFFASGAGAGSGGGEYTAEKLAALRKGQNFQVSTKPAKGAGGGDKGKRVTFVAPGAFVVVCRVVGGGEECVRPSIIHHAC